MSSSYSDNFFVGTSIVLLINDTSHKTSPELIQIRHRIFLTACHSWRLSISSSQDVEIVVEGFSNPLNLQCRAFSL